MKKIAGILSILALSLSATAGFAASQQVITLTAKKGSNPLNTFSYVKKGSEANSGLTKFKAQNHLTATTNQTLIKQRQGASFINGTIDTLPFFNSWFITGSRNSVYTYSMLGHSPKLGGTTGINNRVIPLIIHLTDANGTVLFTFNPLTANGNPDSDYNLLNKSPIFDATTNYNGTGAAQYTDSIHRAQFSNVMKSNWHTVLNPTQPFHVVYSVNLDPTAWSFLVDRNNNIVGEAMDIDVISNIFEQLLQVENTLVGLPNNVFPIIQTDYLTAYDPSNGSCCILGFHTAETGIANPNGILVWTWATFLPLNNDIFGAFADITTVSHEISETFDDPFVNTTVSAWIDGSCSFAQGNLETGDAVEAMNDIDAVSTFTVNNYDFHPQNVALLQWFAHNPLSGGPYSWPRIASLSHKPAASGGCNYGQGPSAFFF